MSSIQYRPEIDGLRAIAVIPVILFHMGFQWIPGGFIGVDIFFVISGYLITSIILKEYDQGIFNFSDFWLRRIKRIMPVLIVMVILTSIAGSLILFGGDINNLGKQGIAALFSYANINLWLFTGNYWGPQAEDSLLLHTWSLSVEEQFYLFFPFLLIILLKFYKKKLASSVFVLSIISALAFVYGAQNYPMATFYLLPTRAWELGSGGLIAIVVYSFDSKLQGNSFLSFFGFMAIILSCFFISGEDGISPYIIISVAGAVLVISFSNDKKNIINRALSFAPILYIGKMSYSLYIWHWPVLVLSKNFSTSSNNSLILLYSIILIIVLSTLSYHFIEKTTRKSSKILPSIVVAFLASASYSVFLTFSESHQDTSMYNETIWKGQLYNVTPNIPMPDSVKKRMEGITVSTNQTSEYDYFAKGGIIKTYGKETPELVVLGDSHGVMWSGVLDEICAELGISVSFYATDGVAPFFNIPIEKQKSTTYFSSEEKYTFDKMRLFYLKEWKPKVVVIAVKWSIRDLQATQDLIKFLDGIGSKVLLIEQPPELFFGDKNTPQYLASINFTPLDDKRRYLPSGNSLAYQKGRDLIRQIAEDNAHCDYIQIADMFMNKNEVWVLDGFDVLYIDDDHLSYSGALKAKNRLMQKLQNHF